ncbi:sensor histidine kinase [Alkalicoccobacillus murimartini]|uniref:histidine kinase n=1 Tax=Alkalicoccobacillus murimartini TaxID=171685 RepID=A0ABT9YJ55_9BACI|nr:sensor histidine kinase [Alkalicoccobacillus murimartini]MDQ0207237.1 two-component system sensor histidine kinase LytS [Alkalicoccobacillus murimartini]
MIELLITMLERLGIIVMIAFILTRFSFFRHLITSNQLNRKQQLIAVLFFGVFGIVGTYSGLTFSTSSSEFSLWATDINTDEAIANFRVIGVVLAGLLGGYKVGIGAGLIAGVHRFFLGGYTAFPCGIASILAGYFAGLFRKDNQRPPLTKALIIGAAAEAVQMLLILLLARPFSQALDLIEMIALPMIIANGLGCALFLLIIKNVVYQEDKIGASQTQLSLRIADQTLVYLRKGLNASSAQAVCQILHSETQTIAVSITNKTNILAHVGMASDHHQQKSPIQTQVTRDVIRDGQLVIAKNQMIHCSHPDCPLGAAVIAPLKQRGETIGTLKFYFHSAKEISPLSIELISGLSALLSSQLEIANADHAYKLAQEAEITALQAQISPHFLFNSLNTITSLIRIDPGKARKLLVSLSHFLRQNLSATTESSITFEQELRHMKAYLTIEETRFNDKFTVIYDIDENCLMEKLPPLTLQPIVENAIKHGIYPLDRACTLTIRINRWRDKIYVTVEDTGKGMDRETADLIKHSHVPSETGSGLAMHNINRRLTLMFGADAALQIESEPNQGTSVRFAIPIMEDR